MVENQEKNANNRLIVNRETRQWSSQAGTSIGPNHMTSNTKCVLLVEKMDTWIRTAKTSKQTKGKTL